MEGTRAGWESGTWAGAEGRLCVARNVSRRAARRRTQTPAVRALHVQSITLYVFVHLSGSSSTQGQEVTRGLWGGAVEDWRLLEGQCRVSAKCESVPTPSPRPRERAGLQPTPNYSHASKRQRSQWSRLTPELQPVVASHMSSEVAGCLTFVDGATYRSLRSSYQTTRLAAGRSRLSCSTGAVRSGPGGCGGGGSCCACSTPVHVSAPVMWLPRTALMLLPLLPWTLV